MQHVAYFCLFDNQFHVQCNLIDVLFKHFNSCNKLIKTIMLTVIKLHQHVLCRCVSIVLYTNFDIRVGS